MMNSPTRSTETPLTTEIIERVADHKGVDSTDLPPLSRTVDPDALEALFSHVTDGTERGPVRVSFEYAGYTLHVNADTERVITVE